MYCPTHFYLKYITTPVEFNQGYDSSCEMKRLKNKRAIFLCFSAVVALLFAAFISYYIFFIRKSSISYKKQGEATIPASDSTSPLATVLNKDVHSEKESISTSEMLPDEINLRILKENSDREKSDVIIKNEQVKIDTAAHLEINNHLSEEESCESEEEACEESTADGIEDKRTLLWKYLLNIDDSEARRKLDSALPHNSRPIDQLYRTIYEDALACIGQDTLRLLKNGKGTDRMQNLACEVHETFEGMRRLGYVTDTFLEPKVPDFLFLNVNWFHAFCNGDIESLIEKPVVKLKAISRVFAYFKMNPPFDVSLLENQWNAINNGILDPMISLLYIRELRYRKGRFEDILQETRQRIKNIFDSSGIKEPENHSAGLLLSMNFQSTLQVLEARFFPPKLPWDELLVLDGKPRPLKNVNCICYGIATFQCLANFLPLWKLTVMKNFKLSENANSSFRINRILEELGSSETSEFDVTKYFEMTSWSDAYLFFQNLFSVIRQDGLPLEHFSGTFRIEPYTVYNHPLNAYHVPQASFHASIAWNSQFLAY